MTYAKGGFQMSQMASRTAVIVDSHPLWLDALQILLEKLELSVVGRTTEIGDAHSLVGEQAPDMVLVDYHSAGFDSEKSIIDRAREANPAVTCIVLSDGDDPRERSIAFAAGASVFCAKRAEPIDLAAAVRLAFDHSIHFAASAQAEETAPAPNGKPGEAVRLTKRELEILRLAAEGYSNSQLSKRLWVTEQTVKFHLSNVYRKLNVANRTEASRWAQRNGLLNHSELAPASTAKM